MSKNICNCPTPPGGRSVCEEHQLAICRVKDGVATAECVDPPAKYRPLAREQEDEFLLWATGAITRTPEVTERALDPASASMLLTGEYHNPETGETTTFRFPPAWEIHEALARSLERIQSATSPTDVNIPVRFEANKAWRN